MPKLEFWTGSGRTQGASKWIGGLGSTSDQCGALVPLGLGRMAVQNSLTPDPPLTEILDQS